MNWGDYKPYDPGISGPVQEQPRRAARAAYQRLMRSKEARKAALAKLLKANGLELDSSNVGIQRLQNWFRSSVEEDPSREPGWLKPMWYSVVNDTALFLGDVIVDRAPNLRWEFFTYGRRNISYQRHVIMGFPTPDPKYDVDVDLCVAIYGHRIIAGESTRDDYFVYFVEGAVALAKTGQVIP